MNFFLLIAGRAHFPRLPIISFDKPLVSGCCGYGTHSSKFHGVFIPLLLERLSIMDLLKHHTVECVYMCPSKKSKSDRKRNSLSQLPANPSSFPLSFLFFDAKQPNMEPDLDFFDVTKSMPMFTFIYVDTTSIATQ